MNSWGEDDPTWETHLATPPETVQISTFKTQLGDSLTIGPHANFPEVTGKYNLLRYLRGCSHNIEDACTLFNKHLEVREKYQLNDLRSKCIDILKETPLFGQRDLVHGEHFAAHYPAQLSAGSTPTGNVIIFIAPGGRLKFYCIRSCALCL